MDKDLNNIHRLSAKYKLRMHFIWRSTRFPHRHIYSIKEGCKNGWNADPDAGIYGSRIPSYDFHVLRVKREKKT